LKCGKIEFIEVPIYADIKTSYIPKTLVEEINKILHENKDKYYHGIVDIKDRVYIILEK